MWVQFAMLPSTPCSLPDMSRDQQSVARDNQAHVVVPGSPYPLECPAYPRKPLSWPSNTPIHKSSNSLPKLQMDCSLLGGLNHSFRESCWKFAGHNGCVNL